MSDNFYRAFEDKYRGSRGLIKHRQQVYLSFVSPLLDLYQDASSMDLGCGRGEWLELLNEIGFNSSGVDLDDNMLAACRELGLSVERADAIQTLESLESESQTVISGFHIIEHISFDDLRQFVQQAFRVLKPAGLLILETPNPENIIVSTSDFYLDPTHRKPVPPKLLSFLTEFTGFSRTKVVRLQEPAPLLDGRSVSLHDVLFGVSPDFSVIAQKAAPKKILALFDPPFSKDYGLSLHDIVARHDQQITDLSSRASEELRSAEERARLAEERAGLTEERAKLTEADLHRLRDSLQAAVLTTQIFQANEIKLQTDLQASRSDIEQAMASLAHSNAMLKLADDRVAEMETRAVQAQARVDIAECQAQESELLAINLSKEYELALSIVNSFQTSGSWRATRPLRMIGHLVRGHAGLALMEMGVPRHHVERLAVMFKRRMMAASIENSARETDEQAALASLPLAVTSRPIEDWSEWSPLARQIYTYLKSVSHSSEEAETSRRALHALKHEDATGSQTKRSDGRLRLAFVSPMPPQKTGIAEYSRQLLKELSRHYQVEVIASDDFSASAELLDEFSFRKPQWLKDNLDQVDRVLYHFGNSPFHAYMLPLIEDVPGTIVLHDFFLGHLFAYLEHNQIGQNHWSQALYASHGYLAIQDRFHAKSLDRIIMDYPANFPVIENAQGIVVHSEHARKLAEKWYGLGFADQWKIIPLLREPAAILDRLNARAELGIPSDAFVVCSFGLLSPLKYSHRILEAWLQSRLARDERSILVFVGAVGSEDYDWRLRATIATSTLDEQISITGWTDPDVYQKYLAAADVAVQLRSSSRGETSAAVLDCMSYGLPTIVNAHGSAAELDPHAIWMMPDDFEDAELVEALELLWRDGGRRTALGTRAALAVAANNDPKAAAVWYGEAIETFHSKAASKRQALGARLTEFDARTASDAQMRSFALKTAGELSTNRAQKQLLLDVTATCMTDLKTGIERVARALLLAILREPPKGYRVEPVYLSKEGGNWHYRYARHYTLELLDCQANGFADEVVFPRAGDRLMGLDLASRSVIAAEKNGLFRELKNSGVKIFFMVYDLLPVQMPEVFPPGANISHERWLTAITGFDGAICGSKTVADELALWIKKAERANRTDSLSIGWSHYGSDLRNTAPTRGLPADAEQRLLGMAQCPSFLMTGTIEPRKGHAQVVEAFTQLWQDGHDLNLVIVGNEGWKGLPDSMRRSIPSLVQTIRSHPESGRHLIWLEGTSDEYLDKIYASSTCLIAASFGEGFGLPLIEAARHHLPILARNIPIFREVAQEHAHYFSGEEPADIADAVLSWLLSYKNGTHPRSDGMPWATWEKCATQVLKMVLDEDTTSE